VEIKKNRPSEQYPADIKTIGNYQPLYDFFKHKPCEVPPFLELVN